MAKQCRICSVEKDSCEFYSRPDTSDRLTSECKSCKASFTRSNYASGLPAREHDSDAARNRRLKSQYGIDSDYFDGMLAGQGYKCAICCKSASQLRDVFGQVWSIDHCHSSGKVRGILCHSCNIAIGHFRDNEQILTNAIAYLRKAR